MKKSSVFSKWLPVVLSVAPFLPLQVWAQEHISFGCTIGTAQAEVESGNIKATVLNGGDMFWNLANPRFEVPKGSGKHSISGGAIWFGGKEQGTGDWHLATQMYRQFSPPDAGFWPGQLVLDQFGTPDYQVCEVFNFIAKANSNVVNSFRDFALTAPKPIDEALIPAEIKNWPGKNNPFRPNLITQAGGELAPFADVDGNGIFDPRQGDYPEILGNQCAFAIMNDGGNIKEPITPPIGLEVHIMVYGYDAPSNPAIANSLFARYTFINRGSKTLEETYFGKWVDFGVGNRQDNFIGSDSVRSMFFGYNGDNDDEGAAGYGLNPPAQGVVFLNRPLTNFTYFKDDASILGNPTVASDYHNYMSGNWRNGMPVTYGGNGYGGATPAKFMYSGDPETNTGWTEALVGNIPGDRQGIGSHGPFTFAPGNIKIFDVAYPWAQGNSNLNSVTALKQASGQVQAFYNNNISSRPTESKAALTVQVYPNPATEAVEVILPAATTEQATFTLRDITGRTVLQTTATVSGNQPHKLNVQSLPKGVYLLQVQQGEGSYITKVVKQ